MTFDGGPKGIRLDGLRPEAIDLEAGAWSARDCVVYDETNRELAHLAARMFWQGDLPRPFGVFYRTERPTYEDLLHRRSRASPHARARATCRPSCARARHGR